MRWPSSPAGLAAAASHDAWTAFQTLADGRSPWAKAGGGRVSATTATTTQTTARMTPPTAWNGLAIYRSRTKRVSAVAQGQQRICWRGAARSRIEPSRRRIRAGKRPDFQQRRAPAAFRMQSSNGRWRTLAAAQRCHGSAPGPSDASPRAAMRRALHWCRVVRASCPAGAHAGIGRRGPLERSAPALPAHRRGC